MKVALTGSTGFIGVNLAAHLAEAGHDVVALRRPRTGEEGGGGRGEASGAAAGETSRVLRVEGDVRDRGSLRKAFDGCEAVVHLAALFNAPEASLEEYRDTNVEGTRNVLETARELGVGRVVHCSTVGVASGGEPPYAEDAPYDPPAWDKYETTKAAGERLAIRFHEESGLPVVIIRPAQVYGPGDTSKLKFYKMVKKGVIVSPGRTLKHLIYIDDLCAAFERALHAEAGFGVPIIVASEAPTPLTELVGIAARALGVPAPSVRLPALPVTAAATAVETVFNAVGRKPPIFRRSMNFFTKSVAFRTGNAERYLGFRASTGTEEGVAETVRWYREHGYLER